MLGKNICILQDGVHAVYLLYRPEVTEELELSVSWLRTGAVVTLDADEMEALAARLTKAVKKLRKHQKKLAKDKLVSLDQLEARIHKGKRK